MTEFKPHMVKIFSPYERSLMQIETIIKLVSDGTINKGRYS
jgi:hypothetical protein